MRALAYYISGHGFGHAVRSAEILRQLFRLAPDLEVHVCTTAPAWIFPGPARYRAVDLEVGVVQADALSLDEAATLAAAAELAGRAEGLAREETAFLESIGAGLVVADIPAIAFLAAARAGLPSVGITNFSWDWIYRPYAASKPEFGWLLEWLRGAYHRADLLLRLPFYGDLSAFRATEDVPLVSRPPGAPRSVLRERLGLQPDERAILLSFGGLGLASFPSERLGELRRYTFLATEKEIDPTAPRPDNVRYLPARQENYTDLLAACDGVIGKPGFGLVSNCLAERVPLLYTDRGTFPEYEVLVEAIHRFGRGRHIPQADLLAADLGSHLEMLLEQDSEWPPLRTDGGTVIAHRLLELGGWKATAR